MRKLILLLLLIHSLCYGAAGDVASIGGKAVTAIASVDGKAGTGIAYYCGKPYSDGDGAACAETTDAGLIHGQDAEGTGTPSGWTDTAAGGTVNWDSTSTPLDGSQSLLLAGSGASSYSCYPITSASSLYAHLRYRPTDSTPATSHNIIAFSSDNECSTQVATVDIRTIAYLRVYHGSSYLTSSDVVFGDATLIHIWFEYVAGSGADGSYAVYWSADGTKPGSPNLSGSNGTATASIQSVSVREYANTTGGAYFDQIMIDNAAIGTVCE